MESWIALVASALGGAGFGSLASTWLGWKFERRKLIIEEKLKAYNGFFEAYQNAVAESTEENRQKFVYWQKRIELVATKEIAELTKQFYSSDAQKNQSEIRDSIVILMRKDLDF